ncbi:gamma-glutamyl-gamma-aminobutyrate hydrolase family protein [Marinobacterium arenosum]|uniref:gamma-glutamyl-gamma-aminobutyrate hydrolase family protein n=1 Tax=Marinobacterium arenosum TaxID=2862496 RepID=UPI001C9493E4|nr:gamma-glutamyl-gamma-aminobutyrate hydrolase family protein [Marinobacterium arenosum]MBY4678178.1 gamma-glutamyl-gamma-aminobutyrate hydrolase family protein [Marinobacterium arenosum]
MNLCGVEKRDRPLVGVPACTDQVGIHRFHLVGEKYLRAARDGAGVAPLVMPALGEEMAALLPSLDGLLLTGSYSNVEPHRYGAEPELADSKADPQRDETTLALIRRAVELQIPVLGICRGFQEINVALGGTLHQQLAEVAGMIEHREDKDATLEQQYAVAHELMLEPDGLLARLMNAELKQQVNSLHMQGVDRLAEALRVEGRAPDGLIEAFSLADESSFLLAAQWHPEWQLQRHPFYQAIFSAFGEACRQRARQRASNT